MCLCMCALRSLMGVGNVRCVRTHMYVCKYVCICTVQYMRALQVSKPSEMIEKR
ncbi:uncharacterized protein P884DRAFT_103820 [Thermothelomyces heterothallicus CBS 202.75]|uniref:uncharacterized protein n=1 Tax=Thermothelomyces heterothallicus CBS 202.75 TaxID=1149848 RepID=UPI003742A18E